jgi:hypothetical protein
MGGSELQSYVGYLGFGLALVGLVGFGGIGMLFFTVTGAPLLLLCTLVALVSCTFGLDTALMTSIFEVGSEATPPGKVTVIQLSLAETLGLWHSVPCANNEAFHEIIAWILAHSPS